MQLSPLIEAVYMPVDEGIARVNEFADARAAGAGPHPGDPRPSTPPVGHFTVCVSSQTGCAVDCVFCVTGRLGGGRNLSAGEILGQLHVVLRETGRSMEGMRVVFMGMGEPFLNPEGVLPALDILFELVSPRRVTVSTSGVTPAFPRFAALDKRPNLAVSLNAADPATRERLMPITKTYPLPGLIAAMREWPLEPRRTILVEYVLGRQSDGELSGSFIHDSRADRERKAPFDEERWATLGKHDLHLPAEWRLQTQYAFASDNDHPNDFDDLAKHDDDALRSRLCELDGIGRWSAEYIMLRGFGRLDVFPGDDAGARNKLRRWVSVPEPLDYPSVQRIVGRWHPYAGLAYFHLLLDGLAESGLLTEVPVLPSRTASSVR